MHAVRIFFKLVRWRVEVDIGSGVKGSEISSGLATAIACLKKSRKTAVEVGGGEAEGDF